MSSKKETLEYFKSHSDDPDMKTRYELLSRSKINQVRALQHGLSFCENQK